MTDTQDNMAADKDKTQKLTANFEVRIRFNTGKHGTYNALKLKILMRHIRNLK